MSGVSLENQGNVLSRVLIRTLTFEGEATPNCDASRFIRLTASSDNRCFKDQRSGNRL